ncbi:unnamed protein product [Fusarium graminearum]|nr:unnamed protein product [Fusarium graminearum]
MATSVEVQDKSLALDPEANALSVSDSGSDRPTPTTEEREKLRKIAGSIPWVSYLLCIVELAERASFYGCKTVFNNFLQFPLPKGGNGAGAVAKDDPNGHAGALNRGLQFASAMVLLFNFLAYVIPIFGAWLGDTKTGRFKAITYGVIIGGVAHVIMVGGAAPAVLKAGNGLAPFMVSFFLLAIGAGLFKPNVVPLIIDQYTDQTEYVKTLKSGERVIVDPETTIQRIMLIFYMCINVGAFFMIATTYIEKYVGFWLAFLLPGIVYILLPVLLMSQYKTLKRTPPQGSDLNTFFKIVGAAIKENKGRLWAKNFFESVKPSVLAAKGKTVSWDSRAVEHARRTLSACLIFLYQPLFYLNNGGVGNVLSNQGASMTMNGAPNDLIHNFNPLTLMIFAPIMSYVLYPLLNKHHIKFGPISRMTVGYISAILGSLVGAIIQWRVYKTSPCGYHGSTCDGVSPVSIWWQLPTVMLGAIGELFTAVTAYEMAYARAPEGMKSTVVAINLAMQALSSALAQILIPSIADPNLIWAWAAPCIALFIQTIIFWVRHRHVNDEKYLIRETFEEDNPACTEKIIVFETAFLHGSAAPFTGETQDTKKHWLRYNTYDGSPSFGTDFDGGKFKLNHWLVAYRNWKTLPEKHASIAAIVEVALSLGMDYNQVAWEYHQLFGFISSKAVLVGWGECNNPYFCNDLSRQIVHHDNDPSRQGFRNHAYLSWGPDFHPEKETDFHGQNRNPEKWNGAPVFIIDACAGPHVGDETRDQYNNTLDSNRDDPKKYPVDIFKQLVAKNKRYSKWTSGVTGLLTRGNDWSLGEVQNEIYPGSPIEWSALDLPAASQQLTMVFGGKISQVQANFTKIISKVKFDKPYAPDDLFSAPIPNEKDQFGNIITEEKVYEKSDISVSYFSLMIHFTPSYEKAIELIKYRTTQYSISDTHPTLMEQKSTSNIIMIGGKYLKLFVFANLVVELSCLDGTAYLQSIADQVAEYFEASEGDLVAPAQWESCLN